MLILIPAAAFCQYNQPGGGGQAGPNDVLMEQYVTSGAATLSDSLMSGAQLNNYGESAPEVWTAADNNRNLRFVITCGTAGQSLSFKPASGGVIILDGIALTVNHKITNLNTALGNKVACSTFTTGANSCSWSCNSDGSFADGGL
jgi:hypothetical protein